MNENSIILPRRIYALLGDGERVRQLNLYFRNMITGYFGDKVVEIRCEHGKQYQDFWRIEAGNDNVRQYAVTEGCFELTVQIKDFDFRVIREASATVEVLPATATDKCRLLCIGDSITRGGFFIEHVGQILPGIESVGTRTYDDGLANKEGRGGWSCKSFLYANDLAYPCDVCFQSPFMFPKGVEGRRFWGNTAFWESVVDKEPQGYDFHGFQKIAASWGNQAGPYIFDSTGYPLHPAEGDVVFDPTKAKGENFLIRVGRAWTTMPEQPAWELSFSKYMERYECAYLQNGVFCPPDIVSIMFGPNDVPSLEYMDGFIDSLKRLIASIKEYDRAMKIIVNLPVSGSILNQQQKSSEYYRRLMQESGKRILDEWDNDQALEDNIHVCGMLLGVDPVYGYGTVEEPAFLYAREKRCLPGDAIHPSTQGHRQMGDMLAGVIQKIR